MLCRKSPELIHFLVTSLYSLTKISNFYPQPQLLVTTILLSVSTAAAKSLQSCPTLCDPIEGSPPGSPIPGILQARTLEWVAISFSDAWKWKIKVKFLSRVRLLATSWTAAYQAPPSMGFSRQEYWSGVPSPSPLCFCSAFLDSTCEWHSAVFVFLWLPSLCTTPYKYSCLENHLHLLNSGDSELHLGGPSLCHSLKTLSGSELGQLRAYLTYFSPLGDSCPLLLDASHPDQPVFHVFSPFFINFINFHQFSSFKQEPKSSSLLLHKASHLEFWKLKWAPVMGELCLSSPCWSTWNPWLHSANPVMLSNTMNASLTSTEAGWWWPRNLPHCKQNTLGQSPRHQKEEIPGQAQCPS